jgi:nucleotide-binding universal stress UspA family protein
MKFLVGYNGSNEAKAALELAAEHALVFSAEIIVVASTGGGTGEKPEDIGKATLDLQFAEQFLLEKGIVSQCHQLARGLNPGEDLVRFAVDNDIDQIFVGIEKKSRTQKILLRSNAQYIILKAHCPVMTVK